MLSRHTCITFLVLALFANAIPSYHQPQDPEQCQSVTTVFRTVTFTAQAIATPSANDGGTKEHNLGGGHPFSNTTTSSRTANPGDSADKKDGGSKGKNTNGGNKNKNTGKSRNGGNDEDLQKSLTLDPRVIAKGFATDGQNPPVAGQVPSLTSANNFINFCLTVPNLPITNGKQITTGSCNPAPIGVIPSVDNMPSAKFVFPKNFGTIKARQSFTIEMNIKNIDTGFFVNAQANYFAAPQQLNKGGQVKGHSHVVVEKLESLDQTKPTNPKTFNFFKGLNNAATNGKLTAAVDKGLEPGFYRLSSINTSSNHQPVIVPVAQHGSLDDVIYFTVTNDGKPLKDSNLGSSKATPVSTELPHSSASESCSPVVPSPKKKNK